MQAPTPSRPQQEKKALTSLTNLHIHPLKAKTNMQLAYVDEHIWCWWRVIFNP